MRRLPRLLLERLVINERAQATVEYALVVGVTVALLLGISGAVVGGFSAYHRSVTSVVCLPIP